ncbi:MAG: hypothetical protein M0Q94_02485 [Candidatus Cloacimonetes bacterium]|nr:hypothetical protein [Candidatus Cloacimonadota bacterium]
MDEYEMRIVKTKIAIKEAIKENNFYNPWEKGSIIVKKNRKILDLDLNEIQNKKNSLTGKRILSEFNDANDPLVHYQFPLPINGNFLKAKYLLLYSNPSLEESPLESNGAKLKREEIENRLLKCFKLDEDATLVIPNDDWKKWYTKELDRFYSEENEDFINKFCFINLFAYQTLSDEFDLNVKEIEEMKLLPSTKFVEELVQIGTKAGKEIFIMRTSENVWKVRRSNNNIKKDYNFYKLELEVSK